MSETLSDLVDLSFATPQLSAIESLAGIEVLCSDKTGTLTTNKLTVHEPFVLENVSENDMMLCGALAASHKKRGMDPIDRAIIKSLYDYPEVLEIAKKYKTVSFQPFDPVSKRVTAIVQTPEGKTITCAKGGEDFGRELLALVLKTVFLLLEPHLFIPSPAPPFTSSQRHPQAHQRILPTNPRRRRKSLQRQGRRVCFPRVQVAGCRLAWERRRRVGASWDLAVV